MMRFLELKVPLAMTLQAFPSWEVSLRVEAR